ncbi:hypothetical protein CC86DRAFT_456785 [Ophiobolus disseminans]|uniref:C2H2-type domain-containing protein n=1 Tax=Ophiobolus disseminans TaxID=1469910 RepID=A0A6A6ZVC3_9PLEO|nr:hypothetical protein CC86DRAFT_456785 [Ophiobolus disseminans]
MSTQYPSVQPPQGFQYVLYPDGKWYCVQYTNTRPDAQHGTGGQQNRSTTSGYSQSSSGYDQSTGRNVASQPRQRESLAPSSGSQASAGRVDHRITTYEGEVATSHPDKVTFYPPAPHRELNQRERRQQVPASQIGPRASESPNNAAAVNTGSGGTTRNDPAAWVQEFAASSSNSTGAHSRHIEPHRGAAPPVNTSTSSQDASAQNSLTEIGKIFYNAKTQEIVHKCTVDGCTGKTIKRAVDFKRHHNKYHGGSVLDCPIAECFYSEGRRDKLIEHCRKKHGLDYATWCLDQTEL